MSHPPIQIVDENDNPVGGASMDEAQFKGLYHRIVRVMIENEDGEVLLQKRSPNMFLAAGLWDHSAAGHVDEGEDYMTAGKRELKEEIGLEIELEEVGKYKSNSSHGGRKFNRFNMVLKGGASKNTPLNINKNEVSEVKWYSVEKLKKLVDQNPEVYTTGLAEVIKHYF